MKCPRLVFVLMMLVGCVPFLARANGPLRSIVVFGNEKTDRETILDIVGLESRIYISPKVAREVDDRLVNSGLFKTVRVEMVDNPDGTADLRVVVVEKQLWFTFPVFKAWSGIYTGGAVFGESNLFVPAASTLLLMQGGNKGYRGLVAFDAKNIFNSRFVVRTWAMVESNLHPIYNDDQKIDEIRLKQVVASLKPGYQWTNDIRTSAEFKYRYLSYGDSPFVTLSGETGGDISVGFEFLFDSLRRREAFIKGRKIRASYEFAESRFGTDFTYHIQEVEWQEALTLFGFFNYVVRMKGAIGDETLPFHRDLTLGGSSLRGYNEQQFRGDTRLMAKQDLLFRIWRHRRFSLFGAIFYDMGLLYFDRDGISRSAFRNGTGGGLRVSLADILAPVFGLDFSYGIEDQAFRMYFAVGIVEF